jgi:hypothetical protein
MRNVRQMAEGRKSDLFHTWFLDRPDLGVSVSVVGQARWLSTETAQHRNTNNKGK